MAGSMHKAAFFCENKPPNFGHLWEVFDEPRRNRIASLASLHPQVVSSANLAQLAAELGDVDVAFATWGMPALTSSHLDLLPSLRAVFYAAGSVKGFAGPLLERGIIVVGAADANAVPVAEYALAAILHALKRFWPQAMALRNRKDPSAWRRQPMTGAYGSVVGLVGLSMVGRHVRRLLRGFDLKVLAYDPTVSPEQARGMDVELVGLEELFGRADVVSLHAPSIPATRGMITGAMLESMKPDATFINTARGAIVREDQMTAVLKRRPDLWAILDVTEPEPPPAGSPLYELPNVLLTPHIAGSMGPEVKRMGDLVIQEFQAWCEGRPLRFAVRLDDLPTLG